MLWTHKSACIDCTHMQLRMHASSRKHYPGRRAGRILPYFSPRIRVIRALKKSEAQILSLPITQKEFEPTVLHLPSTVL